MALSPVASFDSFTRTVSAGLGINDVGHRWENVDGTASNDSYFTVSNTTGVSTLSIPGGTALSKGFRSQVLDTTYGSNVVSASTSGVVVLRLRFSVLSDTHFVGVSLRNANGRFIGARVYAGTTSMRLSLVYVDSNGNLVEGNYGWTSALQSTNDVWLKLTISGNTITGKVWQLGTNETTAMIVTASTTTAMPSASGFPGLFYGVSTTTAAVSTTFNTLYYTLSGWQNNLLPVTDTFNRDVIPGLGYSDSGHLWLGDLNDDYSAYVTSRLGQAVNASNRADITLPASSIRAGYIGPSVNTIKVEIKGLVRFLNPYSYIRLGIGDPIVFDEDGTTNVLTGYALLIGPEVAIIQKYDPTYGWVPWMYGPSAYLYPFLVTTGSTGTRLRVKFWINSIYTICGKVWVSGTPEPADWDLTFSDTGSPTYSQGRAFVELTNDGSTSARFHLQQYSVAYADYPTIVSTMSQTATLTAALKNLRKCQVAGSAATNVTAQLSDAKKVFGTIGNATTSNFTVPTLQIMKTELASTLTASANATPNLTLNVGLKTALSAQSDGLSANLFNNKKEGSIDAVLSAGRQTDDANVVGTLTFNLRSTVSAEGRIGYQFRVFSGDVETIVRFGVADHSVQAVLSAGLPAGASPPVIGTMIQRHLLQAALNQILEDEIPRNLSATLTSVENRLAITFASALVPTATLTGSGAQLGGMTPRSGLFPARFSILKLGVNYAIQQSWVIEPVMSVSSLRTEVLLLPAPEVSAAEVEYIMNRFMAFSGISDTSGSVQIIKGSALAKLSAASSTQARATYEFSENALDLIEFSPAKIIRAEHFNTNFHRLSWVIGDESSSAEFVVPDTVRLGDAISASFAAPTDRDYPIYDPDGYLYGKKFFIGFGVTERVKWNEQEDRLEATYNQVHLRDRPVTGLGLGERGLTYYYGIGDDEDRLTERFRPFFRVSPEPYIYLAASVLDGKRPIQQPDEDEPDDDDETTTDPVTFPVHSWVRVTADKLLIQSGPGLQFTKVGEVWKGTVLYITGAPVRANKLTWYPHMVAVTDLGGSPMTGWSDGKYMELVPVTDFTPSAESLADATVTPQWNWGPPLTTTLPPTRTTTTTPQPDQSATETAYRLFYTPLASPLLVLDANKHWNAPRGKAYELPATFAGVRAVDVLVTLETRRHTDARLAVYGDGCVPSSGLVCASEQDQQQFYRGTVPLSTKPTLILASTTPIAAMTVEVVGIWK